MEMFYKKEIYNTDVFKLCVVSIVLVNEATVQKRKKMNTIIMAIMELL